MTAGLTTERLVTLLIALVAASIAALMRAWRERNTQRRAGEPVSSLLSAIPDVVLGGMAGISFAIFANWIKQTDAEVTWLFAMVGGAAGPKLLDVLLGLLVKARGMDTGGTGDADGQK